VQACCSENKQRDFDSLKIERFIGLFANLASDERTHITDALFSLTRQFRAFDK